MKISPKTAFRVGPHIASGGSALMALRRARKTGDTLQLIDAVVSIAAVITGILLLVRELRKGDVSE